MSSTVATIPFWCSIPEGNLLDHSQVNSYGRPHSITIDAGDMFLIDDGAHFIEKRTLDGKLLFTLGERGNPVPRHSGGDGSRFNRPTDLAVHPLHSRAVRVRRLCQLTYPSVQPRGRAHHVLG